MAQCKRCGKEMSSFSLSGMKGICPECEKQMAPYRAQAATVAEPATPFVTLGLLILNIAYFVVMILNGVSPMEPDGAQILRWGSEFGPLTLGPEPWRLITCMFIHIGFIHLLFNMWCLYDLGRMAEPIFGHRAFLTIYVGAGVCGGYLSLLWNPLRPSAGASGAIFGIAGALIAAFKFGNLPLDPFALKRTMRSVALFAFYNLVIGLGAGINNMAHLGGLIGGFAIAFILTRFFPPHSERFEKAFFPVLGATVVLLVAAFFGLRELKADQLLLGQAELALADKDCNTATPVLERAVAKRPEIAEAHRDLGWCYEHSGRARDAAREYARSAELDPKDAFAWLRMGWIFLSQDENASAETAFRGALVADPQSAEAHQGLGIALVDGGHGDAGLKELQQALASAPDDPKILQSVVYANRKLGHFADAINPLTHLVELEPNDPGRHGDLADAYEEAGDAKNAARERQVAEQLAAKQAATPTPTPTPAR